jgi:hypothetical protein
MKICSAILELLDEDRQIDTAKLIDAFLKIFVANAFPLTRRSVWESKFLNGMFYNSHLGDCGSSLLFEW